MSVARTIPIITPDWLLARVVDNGDGCLIWTHAAANNGRDPRAGVGGKIINVRRVLWMQTHGREPRKNEVAVPCCDNPLCVEPSHIVMRSRSKVLAGRTFPPLQRARIAASKRANSRLTDEMVREIRASDLSNTQEAQRHGIHRDYVRKLRLGTVRRDYANPFAQLGA